MPIEFLNIASNCVTRARVSCVRVTQFILRYVTVHIGLSDKKHLIINPLTKVTMYKVSFTSDGVSAPFALCPSIEEAVQMALAVHSASNVPHVVGVFSASDSCVLSLQKVKSDAKS